MEPMQTNFPIFEANQVLMNTHLNQVFNYLDEQERLSRANLIGIGIVCGLELRLNGTTIHLSKGCGVTSEGYLIVEPKDADLVLYRNYTLPTAVEYKPLQGVTLWELFPAGEPNAAALSALPPNFLDDKVVVLFLELKQEGLRNCSPNNCDDKGAEVTVTLRRLLIGKNQLNEVLAASTESGLTPKALADNQAAILGLPDIRLPRYDVPNTNPTTSEDVLSGFFAALRKDTLAPRTHEALSKAYDAFKSVLEDLYPTNPFGPFLPTFGFVNTAPQTPEQVRFLQYYYDFFDDLLKAYDEFRQVAGELLCLCCPHADLFPRHLMVGEVKPTAEAARYRHRFLPSPAVGDCADKTRDLRMLFQRLVEMTKQFTNTPPLPANTREQIRITPSRLADVPLSTKSIPYYYTQNGTPPLYQLWNPDKTHRQRANQNLSYRADSYSPAAPAFVTNPLSYDLEPYNFLRIEGHLGKKYQDVLRTLAELKSRYRLPIEVIALRTGAFDETMPVDLSKEECRFQDLETLYDTLREELLCTLVEGIRYLYDVPMVNSVLSGGIPTMPLLKKYAANFRHRPGTVGAWYEKYLALIQARPYIDVNQNKIDPIEVLTVYCTLFAGTQDLPPQYNAHVVGIYYLSKLSETLPDSLNQLGYADFENKYQDLLELIRYLRNLELASVPATFQEFVPKEDLIDHFDQVLFSCRLEAFKALVAEYKRRLLEAKQKQFLSHFLSKNPGLQHKAGVPLGGTFVLVYHDDPDPVTKDTRRFFEVNVFSADFAGSTANVRATDFFRSLDKMSKQVEFAQNRDFTDFYVAATGRIPSMPKIDPGQAITKIFRDTVGQIEDGAVIADFFLPYICCSDCAPVQFVLQPPPVTFTVKLECTGDVGAPATITPQGGTGPYTYKVGTGDFQSLDAGKPLLAAGERVLVLRDSIGTESAPQTITVPARLSLVVGNNPYTDDVAAQTYRVNFDITGGTPPYAADSGTVADQTYTSAPVSSGKSLIVKITDAAGCSTTSQEFKHEVPLPCNLPCKGIAKRCGFRFWLPQATERQPYKMLEMQVTKFAFQFPAGTAIDLTAEVQSILTTTQVPLDALTTKFEDVVKMWLVRINKLIASKTGGADNLKLEYQTSKTGAFGILWIEYFECLKFEFSIESNFRRPEMLEFLAATYTPQGTALVLADDTRPVLIPPFDCLRKDKCNPQSQWEAICKAPDNPSVKINPKKEGAGVHLETTTDLPPNLRYVWEVEDGIPAFSNERKAFFNFAHTDPSVKRIWLTVYDEKGCPLAKAESKINLQQ